MMVVRANIAQQHRNAVHVIDNDADLAVVENITKGRAAPNADHGKPGSFDRRNQFELAILQIVVEQRALGITGPPLGVFIHLRINVAIDDEQILPTIIVVVKKSVGKTDKRNRRLRDACLITDIGKKSFSVILKKYVVVIGKGGAHNRQVAVVLI